MTQATNDLPARPNLEHLRKLAKRRMKLLRAVDASAQLADAQLVLAREYGFASWRKLKAHVDSMDDGGRDVLIAGLLNAVGAGDLDAARSLLDRDPSLVNAAGPHPFWGGRPQPLHVAIESDRRALFDLLLDRGANPSGENRGYDLWSPLMLAVHWKRDAMRDELLRRGASVGLYEALMLADDVRVMQILDDDPDVLRQAAPNNATSLHFARTPAAAQRLIERGAPLDAKDKYGRTPVESIAGLGARGAPVVDVLVGHGATLDAVSAARLGDAVQLERAIRADLSRLRDPRVLHAAVEAGHVEIVCGLLDHGADANARRPDGSHGTPLHTAAWAGKLEMVKLLVSRGADVTALDEEHHNTPAGWARTAVEMLARTPCAAVADFLESRAAARSAPASPASPLDAFLDVSVPKPNEDHRAGNTDRGEATLRENPSLSRDDIYAACVLGDAKSVDRILRDRPHLATTPGGLRNWLPLSYLCFSKFLRLRKRSVSGFVRAATLLLDHGADPNSFFLENPNNPESTKETALYGAAGNTHEPKLTKLLLDAGADVNDLTPPQSVGSESLYHASETDDLRCLRLLLERGPRPDNVSYCLARKLDFEDIAGVRLYLRHGADVNHRFSFGDGNTRLHHAVIRGRSLAIIELLLKHGAEVNARNAQGLTAYQLARRYGHTAVAELLLRHGAAPEADDRERFLSACAAGDARVARRILKSQPDLVRTLTPREHRLLSDAADSGHTRAVRLMIDLGFDIDSPGDWGGSALHHAAWNGHVGTMKLLLSRGARIDVKNQWGGDVLHTALHGAAHAGHGKGLQVIRALLPAFRGRDLSSHLDAARSEANAEIVRLIESAMVPPNTLKSKAWKPLMDAALAGDEARARKLLDGGVDPNVQSTTPHRYRPLHRAIEHKKTMPKHVGHERVVKLLLERGADPKLRATPARLTALQLAATGETRFVPLLREHFQPLDIFHAAVLADNRRVEELLRRDPALPRATDEIGLQPLHCAAGSAMFKLGPEFERAQVRVVRMLLDAGADPSATHLFEDKWPIPVLYYCCGLHDNPAVAQVLMDAGADPCDGESVYHAADEDHRGCLALFEARLDRRKLAKECTMCLRNQLHWCRTRGAPWLLAHRADPNAIRKDAGESALHAAARTGASERVIAMLLEHGGDPRVKNREGLDAIELARRARKTRVVRQLEAALKTARPQATKPKRARKKVIRHC